MELSEVWTANQVDTSFAERPNAGKGLLPRRQRTRIGSIAHCVVAASRDVMRPFEKVANRSTSQGQWPMSQGGEWVTSSPFYLAPSCCAKPLLEFILTY